VWGFQHEVDGVQDFLDKFYLDHLDAKFESCGLFVNPKYPFMGVSPDGIVSSACHERSLMEVKCPCSCSKQLFTELEENN